MAEIVSAGSYNNRMEAEMAKSYLEAEGIAAMIQADDAGGWQPFMLPGGGGVHVMVKDSDAEQARALLSDLPELNPTPSD